MTEYIKREYAVDAVADVYYNTPDINLSCEKFEAAILKIQFADVAPVIHARWEKRGSSWYCTHCGIGYRITCGNIPASRHKYCPNCGAKMDEKEE